MVDLARDLAVLQQRAHLRREGQRSVVERVEQRLLADAVARQQQLLAAPVPEREREHAVQVLDAGGAVLLVEVRDHLGVALRREVVPAGAAGRAAARGSCRSRR